MVLDTRNSNKSNKRLHAVDICRGLALLLMIEAHISQSVGWVSNWSRTMAAPFFLIVSGLSYDLFLSSRIKTEVKKYLFLESLFRGFFVYTIPLIPYIIVGLFFIFYSSFLTGNGYKIDIFHWGVFQIIGVGYVFGLFVPNNLKSKILITISTFIITYIITNFFQETLYFLMTGPFPLFPWIGYFLFGRVAYELYQNKHLKDDTTLLSFSIVILIISLLIFETFTKDFTSSTRNQFPMFLLLSSIDLFIFSLLIRYVDNKHIYFSLMNPLEKLGGICFTAYYIHLLIILTIQKSCTNFFNYYPSAISNLINFIIVAVALVQIEKSWRDYNYAFGFEWLIRKGTDKMLKLSKVYL
ncbi:heparan-alpha-glucosaminide N-acetyltransferase domain-containing protein [Methanosarcina acetivorans]|uniref:Heparan-alpha-glucosaminide N-acetyltransferase catalytic domain-containing protein n=1 Tax=Methanosarcina acetivorans (strain ATCC 35395 / DSM 2834 / JCM 12185 / C2A) TaxID=188937 RepID=Q8TNU4_METAC|nr:heparan-alpha-glucosaminide N-acetyltransferase domain-containing protein [Methanosarcina acetivorans]AAM05581.1 predicted protein [Methanosarcina acetivorans C2A]